MCTLPVLFTDKLVKGFGSGQGKYDTQWRNFMLRTQTEISPMFKTQLQAYEIG
jgi:hypothetical protein